MAPKPKDHTLISVKFDAPLLQQIDALAVEENTTRTALLEEGARRVVKARKRKTATPPE